MREKTKNISIIEGTSSLLLENGNGRNYGNFIEWWSQRAIIVNFFFGMDSIAAWLKNKLPKMFFFKFSNNFLASLKLSAFTIAVEALRTNFWDEEKKFFMKIIEP